MADLKQTFILRCLNEYLQRSAKAMAMAMLKMKVGKSGEGLKSITYKALQSGGGAIGSLSFKEYLRMVDMGAGRGHPLGGLMAMKVTLAASNREGFSQVKDRIRKPKKFYSKPAYGELSMLYNSLLYGYTEETIEQLKKEMQ